MMKTSGIKENNSKTQVSKLVYGGSEIAELVTFDVNNSGTLKAARLRESYLKMVERRDGSLARNLVDKHFQLHPSEDPYSFAMEMKGNVVLGVYSDSDGTLMGPRDGCDAVHLFHPRLASAINNTIEKTGLFTIASASHIKRMLVLLEKAQKQVPLERMPFFAENGYAAIIPIKTEKGYEFEIHKAVMPDFVTNSNGKLKSVLDELSKAALDNGLFMFVNYDKEAKVTLELMKNGRDANQRIIDKLVVPYVMKELQLPKDILKTTASGRSIEFPPLVYTIAPTWSSIEIDHNYLTSKKTVNTISNDLVRLLWLRAFGNSDHIEGNRVFIGFGDSPRGSDFGLMDPLRGNIGFSVHPEEHTLGPNEKLIDIIRKESDPPFITLPAFSKDGKVRYGNGEAVASNMNSRLLTGTFFRVKDIREMRLSLREVLREARYAPSPAGAYRTDGSMYTLPGYLAERKDATNLMKVFLSSNTADTRVNEKISATASQLGI